MCLRGLWLRWYYMQGKTMMYFCVDSQKRTRHADAVHLGARWCIVFIRCLMRLILFGLGLWLVCVVVV